MMTSIVNVVNINNLSKIDNFFNDAAYKEIIENSETFNTRLCIERRLRIPFLDSQTRVAQINTVKLGANQRIPGLRDGQVYSYPAARWRKSKRQYLLQRPFPQYNRPFSHLQGPIETEPKEVFTEHSMDNDSRDSHRDSNQEWYYDDMDMHDMEVFDEPEPDSDCDYEESWRSRKRGSKGRSSSGARYGMGNLSGRSKSSGDSLAKRGRGNSRSGGGRSKKQPLDRTITDSPVEKRKPIGMPIVAMSPQPIQPIQQEESVPPMMRERQNNCNVRELEVKLPEDLEEKLLHKAGTSHKVLGSVIPATLIEKGKATPSPYCDFCLGDARENKKTMEAEELVSCSDCGRSGHPSCLQFTSNMIISVRKYRWQCIECKYCTICGTSDNDDQLLFCDDCDRGYHMYCLSPPLVDPPEGSWNCRLCFEEFHKKK